MGAGVRKIARQGHLIVAPCPGSYPRGLPGERTPAIGPGHEPGGEHIPLGQRNAHIFI